MLSSYFFVEDRKKIPLKLTKSPLASCVLQLKQIYFHYRNATQNSGTRLRLTRSVRTGKRSSSIWPLICCEASPTCISVTCKNCWPPSVPKIRRVPVEDPPSKMMSHCLFFMHVNLPKSFFSDKLLEIHIDAMGVS